CAHPAIGVMGWHRASIANGKTGETDWVIYDDYVPRQGILTPNTEVSYVMAFPDLQKTGPLVLDYAPGKIAGIVMDYWQRPQFDYGLTVEFPTKRGHGVKLFSVRTPPGRHTPAMSAAAACCRRPRCTRRPPPGPPPAWRSPRRGPAPFSARRRSSPSARCPSSPPGGSCCT